MAQKNWPQDYPPNKTQLIFAIKQWVHHRNGGELYHGVDDLDRLTSSTLQVIAMSMGYRVPATVTARWAEMKTERAAARAAERAERAAAKAEPEDV